MSAHIACKAAAVPLEKVQVELQSLSEPEQVTLCIGNRTARSMRHLPSRVGSGDGVLHAPLLSKGCAHQDGRHSVRVSPSNSTSYYVKRPQHSSDTCTRGGLGCSAHPEDQHELCMRHHRLNTWCRHRVEDVLWSGVNKGP